MIGVQDYDHFSNVAILKSSISQIENFSNGAILKSNISQMEHFSNGAILKWSNSQMERFGVATLCHISRSQEQRNMACDVLSLRLPERVIFDRNLGRQLCTRLWAPMRKRDKIFAFVFLYSLSIIGREGDSKVARQ